MPPVVAAAAVGAGGAVVGGIIQHRTASNAADAQRRATNEALGHERTREAQAMEQYRLDKSAYDSKLQEWYQKYGDAGLSRYGVSEQDLLFPGTGPRGNTGNRQQRNAPAPPTAPTVPTAQPTAPQNLGSLMGVPVTAPTAPGMPMGSPGLMDSQQAGPGVTGPGMAAPGSLGDLGSWNDWRRYTGGGM